MIAKQIVLATRSEGKLAELRPMFESAGFVVRDLVDEGVEESPDEEALECFDTFEENALAKARYFFSRTKRACVADDSGLEVVALRGAPGVRSKRWSGRTDLSGRALDAANNARLVAALDGVADRRARYVCVAAHVNDSGERIARGEVAGAILSAPRGGGGFGYDPYFFATELGRTFGECTTSEKARVSHRARAMRALLEALVRAG